MLGIGANGMAKQWVFGKVASATWDVFDLPTDMDVVLLCGGGGG